MKNDDGLYTLDDLLNATKDLAHHRGTLKGIQDILRGKREAIESFEKDEALAAADVARCEDTVHKIAAKLKR